MSKSIAPIILAALLAFSACTTTQTASVNTSLATAQADLSKAVSYYQTAKGIALVAEVAQPSLAPTVTKAIAVLDPVVATAQQALASAMADAPTLEAMAQQIISQAVELTQTAAPAVKVIGS